ncbi:MAG: hypothetical protein WC485_01945 [Opitutaceae bacterium]
MSLNRAEQLLFDYIQSHTEERHFWQAKVRAASQQEANELITTSALAHELRFYYRERSQAAALPGEVSFHDDVKNVSFRNMAEHMLRIWGLIRTAKRAKAHGISMRSDNDLKSGV